MCTALFQCPLCSLPHFNSLESLRIGLIKVATENLKCPVCNDVFMGLDKLTIHLFSHCETEPVAKTETYEKFGIEVYPENNKRTHYQNGKLQIEKRTCANSTAGPSNERPNSGKKPSKNQTAQINFKSSESCAISNEPIKIKPRLPIYNMNALPFIGVPKKITNDRQSTHNKNIAGTAKNKSASKEQYLSEKCDICGFYFLGKNILDMHKKLIHNIHESEVVNGVSKYCCHLCPKVFKMRGSLMVHLRMIHFDVVPSIPVEEKGNESEINGCKNIKPHCDKNIYYDNRNSNVFLENKSPPSQEITESLNNLSASNKQWECDICLKLFTTKYFLKKHKRLHTGEMPYACAQCSKTFTFQQSYHKHLLYHNDDKPHTCTQCGRSFKELSTLHNHQRIHTGEKPFSCESCGKCFRQRVSYLVHRRIHTGVMPYKCTACEKSFRYKVSQRTHKCTAQPPGTVIRQAGDLVQKLIKNQTDTKEIIKPEHLATKKHQTYEENMNMQNAHFNQFNSNDYKSILNAFSGQNEENKNNNEFHNVHDIICSTTSRSEQNSPIECRSIQSSPKSIVSDREKNIIDEIVKESLIKMNYSIPGPSNENGFQNEVTDLYSMISSQHIGPEENMASPSDKMRELKLSSSTDDVIENILNDGVMFDKNGSISNIFHLPPLDAMNCYPKECDNQFDPNRPQLQNSFDNNFKR